MSLAIVGRIALNCKSKINIDAYRTVTSSLHLLQGRTVCANKLPVCTVHRRLFHSTFDRKSNLQENIVTEEISMLQIKKRPPRRIKAIIENEKAPQSSVSLERKSSSLSKNLYKLALHAGEMHGTFYKENSFSLYIRHGM